MRNQEMNKLRVAVNHEGDDIMKRLFKKIWYGKHSDAHILTISELMEYGFYCACMGASLIMLLVVLIR